MNKTIKFAIYLVTLASLTVMGQIQRQLCPVGCPTCVEEDPSQEFICVEHSDGTTLGHCADNELIEAYLDAKFEFRCADEFCNCPWVEDSELGY